MIGCSFKDRGGVTGVRSLGSCVFSVSQALSLHSKCTYLVLASHADCLFFPQDVSVSSLKLRCEGSESEWSST